MSTIQRSALVRQPARRMFELVNDVGAYPRLFDWCESSEVLEVSEEHMLATLRVRAAGLRTGFTTRNRLVDGERIELNLVDGPFRRLSGAWQFLALAEHACKVTLHLEFEVNSRVMGSAFAIGFQGLADRMVDDFCRVGERDG
jgi:ribosome-associated toxin RatA of RatAB toxin-antitoxin module